MCYLIRPFKSYTTWKGSSKSSTHTLISYNINFSKTRKRFWRWEGSGLIPEAQHGRIFFSFLFFFSYCFSNAMTNGHQNRQRHTKRRCCSCVCMPSCCHCLCSQENGDKALLGCPLNLASHYQRSSCCDITLTSHAKGYFAKMKTGKGSLGIRRIMSSAHRN